MKTPFFRIAIVLSAAALLVAACKPSETDDIDIGSAPSASFSMRFVEGDSNRVVVTDESQGAFARVWDFGNATTSKKASDTAYFPAAGTYNIQLFISAKGGTGLAAKSVVIAKADNNLCINQKIINLTGGCSAVAGKGWTFSTAAGAIKVGPTVGSGEWFTSTANSLQVDQYDDTFRFFYDQKHFLYENNGKTVFPDQGYKALPYDPPTDATWLLDFGAGNNGTDRFTLPTGSFMGVKDASNVYDIVSLTETELVVQTPFLNNGGYFELTFVKR